MTEIQSMRDVPSASDFTSSPLRNRLRLELDAPVPRVWELLGDLSRFPEFSSGLERVEVVQDEDGRCVEYTCYFKQPQHDLAYKPETPPSDEIRRELAWVAASSWGADQALERVRVELAEEADAEPAAPAGD